MMFFAYLFGAFVFVAGIGLTGPLVTAKHRLAQSMILKYR